MMPDKSTYVEISKVYEHMLELLNTPKKWCRRYYAVNDEGTPTGAADSDAVRWCIYGAYRKFYWFSNYYLPQQTINEGERLLDTVAKDLYNLLPDDVNDRLGYESVFKVIQTAKERCDDYARSA